MSITSLPPLLWRLRVLPFLFTIDLVNLDCASAKDRTFRSELLSCLQNFTLSPTVSVHSTSVLHDVLKWYKLRCILVLSLKAMTLDHAEIQLAWIATTCPNLQMVGFRGNGAKYDYGLDLLGDNCAQITSLHLVNIDLGSSNVFSSFKNRIKHLNCKSCEISAAAFNATLCSGLISLEIGESGVPEEVLSTILASCSILTKAHFFALSNAALVGLVGKCSFLLELTLCRNTFITDHILLAIVTNLRNLKAVELSSLCLITEGALLDIVLLLPNVEILKFHDGMNVSDSVVDCVANSCTRLVEFHISYNQLVTHKSIIQLIISSPKLKIIGVHLPSWYDEVSVDLIAAIIKGKVMFFVPRLLNLHWHYRELLRSLNLLLLNPCKPVDCLETVINV